VRSVVRWYTGWVGGLKQTTAKDMLVKKPTEILKHAVKGMLPKSNLARDQLSKLLVRYKISPINNYTHKLIYMGSKVIFNDSKIFSLINPNLEV
jgi:ribosomal protein L13